MSISPKTDALDAVGELVKTVKSRKTGAVIATIRRLPGGLLAADMKGHPKFRLVCVDPSSPGDAS
jgi:hypothetical protein